MLAKIGWKLLEKHILSQEGQLSTLLIDRDFTLVPSLRNREKSRLLLAKARCFVRHVVIPCEKVGDCTRNRQ